MCAAQRLRAKLPGGSASAPPILAQPGRQDTPSHPLASRVSFSESLCENPKIANRVPTGGQDRAPAKHSGPYSVSIRASPKGQVPTGPTSHTVWRVVRRGGGSAVLRHYLGFHANAAPSWCCHGPRSASRTAGLAVQLTKFFLGLFEDFALFARKLLASSVDVEVEHRHCGAKRGALASITVLGGPFE